MKRTTAKLAKLAELAGQGLSDAQIGDALDLSSRTVFRWRKRAGIASLWRPERAKHGTDSRYATGCSCGPCKTAHALAARTRLAQLQQLSAPFARMHGLPWTPGEDEVLMRLGPARAAIPLQRTYHATLQRAKVLAREALTN